jgi:hypothetical protein
MLFLCASLLYCGCTSAQNQKAQNIRTYVNSFQDCRSTAYAPDVMALVPECKADLPDSKVYQLTTTVWVRRAASSATLHPDPPE